MSTIIGNYGFTIFRNRADAEALAAIGNADDPDSTYAVIDRNDGRFVVEIRDEDGFRVGNV